MAQNTLKDPFEKPTQIFKQRQFALRYQRRGKTIMEYVTALKELVA